MTPDCRDDNDIMKQFRRQNAIGNMLVRKFSFAPIEAEIQLFYINVVFRKFCLQIDEESNSFLAPTVLLLPLSIAKHIISLRSWISERVCYMHRNNHRLL